MVNSNGLVLFYWLLIEWGLFRFGFPGRDSVFLLNFVVQLCAEDEGALSSIWFSSVWSNVACLFSHH